MSRLRWVWCVLLCLLVIALFVAAVVSPVVLILSVLHVPIGIGKPVSGWRSVIGSVIVLLSGYLAFGVGTHFAQRWVRKSGIGALGLRPGSTALKDCALGLGLGAFVACVSVGLSLAFGWYEFVGFSWRFREAGVLVPAVFLALVANLQAPLIEETLFRGFVLQTLLERSDVRFAAVVSSVLFGVSHLTSMESLPWWAAVASTFVAGLVFVQAYLVHRSLWLPIGLHYGWILAGRLLNDTGGPAEKALLVVSKLDGPDLIVTPSGGGAGLFELFGLGVVALLLWRYSRALARDRLGGARRP